MNEIPKSGSDETREICMKYLTSVAIVSILALTLLLSLVILTSHDAGLKYGNPNPATKPIRGPERPEMHGRENVQECENPRMGRLETPGKDRVLSLRILPIPIEFS